MTVLETAFLPLEDSPISFLDANTHPQNRTYKSNSTGSSGCPLSPQLFSYRSGGSSVVRSAANFMSSDSQMCLRSPVRPSMQPWPSVRSCVLPAFLSTWSSLRPISSSQLHTLLHFHPCPINLVVFKGTYLSRRGGLILEGASRLDAFSVYPFPAWLPSYGPGGPAGAPEAGPPRSSRTKGSSPQTSCAHAG